MKMSLAAVNAAFVFLALAAATSRAAELAKFGFEEFSGSYSFDEERGLCAQLSPSAKWVRGGFGGALVTGEDGANATVRALPGLDGADCASVFVRFRRTGNGSGKHPSLLSCGNWGSDGGLLFYSGGKNLAVRLRAGGNGPEASLPALADIPLDRWMSVAFVFKRPSAAVYVNGKLVSKREWNHPLRAGDFRLGSWHGNSFGGYIDDFRVYGHALSAAELGELAGDSRYDEIAGYQDDGTGGIAKDEFAGQEGRPELELKGDAAALVIDTAGCIYSLKENATGRELVGRRIPFVLAKGAAGEQVPLRFEKRGDGLMAWVFPGKGREVVLKAEAFSGGWTFAVEKCSLGACAVKMGRLLPACDKWRGTYVNAWSDEKSAVAVRSYDIEADAKISSDGLYVEVAPPYAAEGRRFGLAAGPRAGILDQLKAMTIVAGVPRSDCGGAWSIGSEQSRKSYVFANVVNGDIDYWIEFVKRGGFSSIHHNASWTSMLGPYPVSTYAYPGGIEEMKRAVEKVHAAGLQTGIHTLTACINVRSDWITPVCDTNLVADAVYTLAQPLTSESKEIVVEEMPVKKHSTVFSYHSNGNVMRIGGELVQYSGIRRTKPYAFTGIKRGAFNTRKNEATIPAGSKIDYLHQRYVAFYPVPGSPLAEKLLGQLAHVYNYCNLDELYFDGSEGMGTRYGIDAMRHGLYSRLKANNGHSPTIEASCPGANNWWFQTRTATTDHAVYGIKRFHDWHIEWAVRRGRLCNFLEPQMGWWQPRLNVDLARGHFIDEMEYFAAKNAGHDASMSIQGVNKRPLPVGIRRQLTVLGWYEYARLARAFTREANAYLAEGENESRLRQDDGGVWRLTPAVADVHRAGLPWTREWTASKALPGKAALRIEALYGAGAAGSGVALLPEKDFAKMVQRAAPGVEAGIERSVSGRNGGKAIRISARNLAAEKNAAWVENRVAFDFPGLDVGAKRSAYGVWVNGDGSGAVLNFQLTSPSEYSGGISDHHVKLDFKGWRYVTFLLRERDADKYCRYSWPYFRSYLSVYRSMIKPAHIESVSFYLNGIEKGGATTVEIGEVEALEMRSLTLKDAAVALNGKKFAVPFAMESGEYAELEEGRWTHYSAFGERLVSVPAAETPVLRADGNSMALTASDDARAEVTVFSFGAPMPALAGKMTPEMKKTMRYEGMMPFEYAPEKGLLPPASIPVRPGGKARLGLEIYGPCENVRFRFKRFFGLKQTVCRFPVKVSADERLVCRDAVNWRLEKAKDGTLVKEGRLERPLPLLGRTQKLDFSADVPSGGVCTVDLMKEYAR